MVWSCRHRHRYPRRESFVILDRAPIEQGSVFATIHPGAGASFREGAAAGKIEGKIELIRTLQELLGLGMSPVEELETRSLVDLTAVAESLQITLRSRRSLSNG